MCIQMGRAPNYQGVGKVLQVLASRARYGAFSRLELVWGKEEFFLLRWLSIEAQSIYDELLRGLRQDSEVCKYERIIRLPCLTGLTEREDRVVKAVARELHHSFGGKLFWGGVLTWDDYFELSAVG